MWTPRWHARTSTPPALAARPPALTRSPGPTARGLPSPTQGAESSYKNPAETAGAPTDPADSGEDADGDTDRVENAVADVVAEPAGHALGRSRGGFSTKLHLSCDGRGLPLTVALTPGQAGDNPQLLGLLDEIRVPTPGPGRPRQRPDRVIADKAYSHPSTRVALRRRRIAVTIPERDDQLARRRERGRGRPYAFDPEIYRDRNVVERCINRLKQWRGIATRYDKTARNYRGGILLASLVLWSRA